MVAIPQISFEMGNGRPYLLLVMATILYVYGLLDFLVGEGRKVWPRFLYALGVLVGSLSHPYFPVIMVLVTGGFFLFRNMYLGESLKQHLARGYFYWGLSVAGGLLAIYVGTLTWMVGSSDFSNFDPFESFLRLGIPVGVREFLVASVALLVLSVAGIFSGYRLAVRGQLSLPLVVGLGLVGIGLTFSLLVSWISYLRHYWILPRQWLPGAIIFFLGIVILLSVLIKKVSRSNVRTSVVAARLLSGIAGLGIALGFFIELDAQARHQQFWSNLSEAELRSYLGDENAFYVYASNLNLHCGGTVWPELEQYYSGGGSADSVASIALRYRECAER